MSDRTRPCPEPRVLAEAAAYKAYAEWLALAEETARLFGTAGLVAPRRLARVFDDDPKLPPSNQTEPAP